MSRNFYYTKILAFTLSEVIIAIAIIGLVAALTIPNFIAYTTANSYKSAFKKTIAALNQAAKSNMQNSGYDFGTTNAYYRVGSSVTPVSTVFNETGTIPYSIIGFDTPTLNTSNTDLGKGNSLFHLFQNNLKLKNSAEVQNYAVAGSPSELSCAGRDDMPGNGSGGMMPGGQGGGNVLDLLGYSGTAETAGQNDTYLIAGMVPQVMLDQIGDGDDSEEGKANSDGKTNLPTVSTNTTFSRPYGGVLALLDSTETKLQMSGGGLKSLCEPVSVSKGGINQGRMFQLQDGAVFTYDPAQAYCTENNPCYGYIDVNGSNGPNRMIACSEDGGYDDFIYSYGTNADEWLMASSCTVENKDVTDIYPVVFYNSTIRPASLAAKSVYYGLKNNQTLEDTIRDTDSAGEMMILQ